MKFKAFFLSIFLFYSFQLNAQWVKHSFNPGFDLTRVKFISENTGWILGYHGIFKTTDGGSNWSASDTSSQSKYYSLHVFDKDLLFCLKYTGSSEEAVISKSTNGGTTWNAIANLTAGHYYKTFYFLNASTGFTIGDSANFPIIQKTNNGGTSWQNVLKLKSDNGTYGTFAGISFAGNKNGWAITYWGILYKTTDGGDSWWLADTLDIVKNGMPAPCASIQFTTADSGWVVGGLRGLSIIQRTTDGGKTWISSAPEQGSSLKEINMVNSQVGFFVGMVYGLNNIAKTIDGGRTWRTQTCNPNFQSGFYSISMVNKDIGWIVGEGGTVYKTTNGGGPTSIVEDNSNKPQSFKLMQNHPNPFNPSTVINYELKTPEHVTLKVYDLLGREAETLINEYQSAGLYKVDFNASGLSAGIYVYQLKAGEQFIGTKKMIFLK